MKEDSLYLENRSPLAYKVSRQGALAFCLAVLIGAYLLYLCGALLWGHSFFYKMLPLLFVLAGLAHLFLLRRYLSGLTVTERWLLSVGLFVAVLVLLGCSALWDGQLLLQTTLACAGGFLLPFILNELWLMYETISFSGFRPFSFTGETADHLPDSYLHALRLRFKVIQEPTTGSAGAIPVLASGRMKLCDVFLDTAQKQNKNGQQTIALKSREEEIYSWVFYTTDMLLWYRALDPEKTLLDNKIGMNALIYVQRVSKNAFALGPAEEKNLQKQ